MPDRSMAERGIDQEHYAGTAICAATARCRTPASASSAPSPTSPVSPTSATQSPSRERRETRDIDPDCLSARVAPTNCQRPKSPLRPDCNLRLGTLGGRIKRPHRGAAPR
jgi:hypothetical protein